MRWATLLLVALFFTAPSYALEIGPFLKGTQILNEAGVPTSVQNPLPTDGDSVYVKDIDVVNSDNGGFSGSVTDYFDSLKTVNNDASVTNPKTIKIWLNRTILTHSIGFGCDDLSKSFSNIVIKAIGSGEEVRFTKDLSADSTKHNSLLVELPQLALNGIIIEFHTTDEIGLSNLIIFKTNDVHATLAAQVPDGGIVDIGATSSGNLKVSNAEDGLAIAKGEVVGTSFIHKFGSAPDFATSDGIVTVWDGADGGGIDQMGYVYSTTAAIDTISSDSGSDTQLLEIQGVDINYNVVEQTATLTGQAKVTLGTSLLRIFRMVNTNSTDNVGHIYCYEDTAIVTGTPSDPTKVRAVIQPGNNQTLMAIYTVPAGKTGYLRDWYASTSGANKTSNYIIEARARPLGQVFQLKHLAAISDNGSSYIKHNYAEPEVFLEKTDIEIRTQVTAVGATGASISAGFDIVLVDN